MGLPAVQEKTSDLGSQIKEVSATVTKAYVTNALALAQAKIKSGEIVKDVLEASKSGAATPQKIARELAKNYATEAAKMTATDLAKQGLGHLTPDPKVNEFYIHIIFDVIVPVLSGDWPGIAIDVYKSGALQEINDDHSKMVERLKSIAESLMGGAQANEEKLQKIVEAAREKNLPGINNAVERMVEERLGDAIPPDAPTPPGPAGPVSGAPELSGGAPEDLTPGGVAAPGLIPGAESAGGAGGQPGGQSGGQSGAGVGGGGSSEPSGAGATPRPDPGLDPGAPTDTGGGSQAGGGSGGEGDGAAGAAAPPPPDAPGNFVPRASNPPAGDWVALIDGRPGENGQPTTWYNTKTKETKQQNADPNAEDAERKRQEEEAKKKEEEEKRRKEEEEAKKKEEEEKEKQEEAKKKAEDEDDGEVDDYTPGDRESHAEFSEAQLIAILQQKNDSLILKTEFSSQLSQAEAAAFAEEMALVRWQTVSYPAEGAGGAPEGIGTGDALAELLEMQKELWSPGDPTPAAGGGSNAQLGSPDDDFLFG